MTNYETVIVLSGSLNDAQVKEEISKVQKIIEGTQGKEITADIWGKRELSYAMKGQKIGTYVAYTYQSEVSETVDQLSGTLRITENVLKFQTHRTSDAKRKVKINPRKKTRTSAEEILAESDNDF